ncbi:MAG: protease complex subunit PrcB family protein [Verrucomicrobiota bacterium]|nr:protease complex subunit PrcB family protein [Verrucomicrobiota bacterium]
MKILALIATIVLTTVSVQAQLSPPTLETTIKPHPAPVPSPATPSAPVAAARSESEQALVQWSGQYEGGREFATQFIKTQEAWTRFWSRMNGSPPKELNEENEMAVFIAFGKRPTGGFMPEIISAKVIEDKLIIEYTDGNPTPETFTTQAITYPWVIAIVPKSKLPIEVREQRNK